MLGRLATFEATGIYAAADRAVGMAFVPVMALLTATYARFFRAGTEGMAGTTAFARRLLPAAAGYGAFVGVALFLLAPLAPIVLGSDFQSSEAALRWLSPIPFLSALAYLAADALTGADAQGVRTIVQAAAAVVNVGLNLWLIPAYSWRGAAWATIASFAFLATALWIVSWRLVRDERRSGGPRPQSLVLDLPEPGA
jgi:O-antigen/teichoic acid export membrane protein